MYIAIIQKADVITLIGNQLVWQTNRKLKFCIVLYADWLSSELMMCVVSTVPSSTTGHN